MQSLLILGRQPELGLAELESLYGPEKISQLSKHVAILDVDPCLLAFKRLGGSLKFAKLLTTLDYTDWHKIETFLVNSAPDQSAKIPAGKMTLGLSLYGFDVEIRQISKTALKIKRSIQKTGRSVRNVPNKNPDLNTAQVIHNKLTSDRAWELLIVKSAGKTYIAQTVMVQDIEGYAKRDQNRPFRDARVGMLPPKLAQIIVNLACGKLPEEMLKSICEDIENKNQNLKLNQIILDPFCGSGVILQEAFLMGYDFIGSDLDPRMVEYSKKNLDWLTKGQGSSFNSDTITEGDARTTTWPKFDYLATEVNLGKPFSTTPTAAELEENINKIDRLLTDFLRNVAKQTSTGTRICLAVPAWQLSKNSFKNLPLIDQIPDLGYNFIDFKHNSARELIYYRPDQIVGRRLLTLVRK